jgi:homoserine acetyltransferase
MTGMVNLQSLVDLGMKFPKYNYDDMVLANYKLLTEHLKVDHLRLVMGTSMGGMHTGFGIYLSKLYGCVDAFS